MRVTFATSYDKMLGNIARKNEDLSSLSSMIASGKRLLAPEDDPVAWSQSMDIKENVRAMEAYGKNIDFGIGWNQAAENAFNGVFDMLTEAKNVGMQAVSASTDEARDACTKRLEEIAEHVLSLANSQYGDQYIFSGRSTTTRPFSIDPLTGQYLYNGDTESFDVRVGKSLTRTINLDGQTAFFDSSSGVNIMETLANLKNAVQSGDTDLIGDLLTSVDSAQKHVSKMSSTAGVRMKSFEDQASMLSNIKIESQSRLSDLEDADMAEVITQFQMKQTTLEAALQVTTLVNNLNLSKMI